MDEKSLMEMHSTVAASHAILARLEPIITKHEDRIEAVERCISDVKTTAKRLAWVASLVMAAGAWIWDKYEKIFK